MSNPRRLCGQYKLAKCNIYLVVQGWSHDILLGWILVQADFQSVLRSLGVCFPFCFEFIDTLHFGNSLREVVESAICITGRFAQEYSV